MPQESAHKKMVIPPIGGQMYTDFLDQNIGLRFINCSPVIHEQNNAKPAVTIEPRPFLNYPYTQLASGGATGALRGVYEAFDGIAYERYFALGNKLYKGSGTEIGTLQYTTGYVGMVAVENKLYILETAVANAYIHEHTIGTTSISSTNLTVPATGDPIYLDGYLFVCSGFSPGNPFIFNSSLSDLTSFDVVNDYIEAEEYADTPIYLAKHHNHLVSFGHSSIEFFYNAGHALGSPLQRNTSYAKRIGIVSPGHLIKPTLVEDKDDIYFFSRDGSGSICVHRIRNFQIEKVSNSYLDALLNRADSTDTSNSNLEASLSLDVVKAHGTTCLLAKVRRNNVFRYFCFNPLNNIWSEWSFNTAEFSTYTIYKCTNTAETGGDRGKTSVYLTNGSLIRHSYLESFPDAQADEELSCKIVTGMFDFDSFLYKTITKVGIKGYYSPVETSIELYTHKHDDYATPRYHGIKQGEVLRDRGAVFNSLGKTRKIAFEVNITTRQHFVYQGLDVYYTQGIV